jgi:hypothetical protein
MFNRYAEFPQTHFTITPSNDNDLKFPMIIYCGSSGTIAIHDKNGTAVTYTVIAGDILPVLAARVLSTGTNVSQVIGLF